MKKLLATSLLAVSILGLAAPASAATTNATTEGDVTFEADDTKEGGQNIVVPIDGELIPMMPTKEDGTTMDGSKSDGALRLEFVPNFHFGTKKNSADNQSYNSQFSTGWYKQTDGSQTTMAKSPLFAQVSDETGNSSSKWSLSVKQVTPFQNGSKVLQNTRVHIYSVQYFNTRAAGGAGNTGVDFVTPMSITDYTEIPLSSDITLMSADSKTNNSKTSVVFSDAATYDPTASYEPTTADNAGLQLFVPGADVTENGVTYTADFQWTLTDAS